MYERKKERVRRQIATTGMLFGTQLNCIKVTIATHNPILAIPIRY
jgi:hypothetical protein